ncbi:ATP phosphoribosyltransferase regulatory subunit [Pullulanibacillus camelliae]|uniref:ATP phosphoribosyltransferase regulatory subunit n=1 Tax=Pullulanibacillus camelliae TaxID=1707096 RepID=A0A8J2VS72_9BACL|nr:ATP phosphoribosyltransferase regulatory subunit [Pullulanibacillus camelliae]GGE39879.1 ATP phosphoribosyltransferase regulatory subunit [Pullulanibacillus camelliae]
MMQLPSGSQDALGLIVNQRLEIFEKFHRTTTIRGFNTISTPVVEYAETFTNPFIGMKLQSMLKWFDEDGEIEVLRPDWTIAIARALANDHSHCKKWAYQGSVFQRDKPGMEYRQVGIEVVDTDPTLGEFECLFLAKQFLKEIQCEPYYIELGHTGFFEQLTLAMQLTDKVSEQLRQAMHDKNKDQVFKIAKQHSNQQHAEELVELINAFGSTEILDRYATHWSNHSELLGIIDHLKTIVKVLQDIGMNQILIDLGRVKNLPYYSGIMFRGFSQTKGTTLFSGGRYDRLYDQYERKRTAVGLAFDVDELVHHIKARSNQKRICLLASIDTLAEAELLLQEYGDCIIDIQFERDEAKTYDLVLQIVKKNGAIEVIHQ